LLYVRIDMLVIRRRRRRSRWRGRWDMSATISTHALVLTCGLNFTRAEGICSAHWMCIYNFFRSAATGSGHCNGRRKRRVICHSPQNTRSRIAQRDQARKKLKRHKNFSANTKRGELISQGQQQQRSSSSSTPLVARGQIPREHREAAVGTHGAN